jgi:fibronectin-binding autotransporter adhesin
MIHFSPTSHTSMNNHLFPTSSILAIAKARRFSIAACSAVSLASIAIIAPAQAATVTWSTANATTTSWSLGSNWVGGVAPVAGDDVIVTADGAFDPTNNSAYTGITINSFTVTGAAGLSLSSRLNVGAGGVFNNIPATNSLTLSGGVELAVDQTWGGTRTIFVAGANPVTGAGKMRFDGSAIRFDGNSSTWSAGLDVHTSVATNQAGFAAGATMTPFGTGTVTMINARADGVTASNPSLALDANTANISRATGQTLANNITLQNSGSGTTFSILTSGTTGDGRFFVLSGDITGNAANRTLLFQAATSGDTNRTTVILTGNNTYTATTQVNNFSTRPLTLQVGDGGTTGTLGIGNISVTGNNILAFNRSDALSVANAISGAGVVSQIGTGTTTLSGNNTYTGATVVNAGTLVLDSSVGGALASTVDLTVSNATLRVSRSEQVNNAAALTLSNATIERGIGVSETFGSLSLTANSTLDFGLGATGTLTFGAYTPINQLTINNFLVGNVLRFSSDLTASIENTSFFSFDNQFTYDWNTTTPGLFTVTAIPEPSTWALLACSLTILMVFRRRRSAHGLQA